MKPRLLDLFCGAGGCSVGYHRAGFQVVGVDNRPQPHYPYEFIQADAMTYPLDGYNAIHASPPCQAYSIATRNSSTADHAAHVAATGHMLPDTITRLLPLTIPWVVENVPGSEHEMRAAPWRITLCGSQHRITTTDGRQFRLRRHRIFASNVFLLAEPCSCDGRQPAPVSGHGAPGRLTASVVAHGGTHSTRSKAKGGVAFTADEARQLMGCEWMTRDELSQAIPPAYTQHIGEQLLAHLSQDRKKAAGE